MSNLLHAGVSSLVIGPLLVCGKFECAIFFPKDHLAKGQEIMVLNWLSVRKCQVLPPFDFSRKRSASGAFNKTVFAEGSAKRAGRGKFASSSAWPERVFARLEAGQVFEHGRRSVERFTKARNGALKKY